MTMREAVARFVPDGASVLLGAGLEGLIPLSAGHEIIRQRKRLQVIPLRSLRDQGPGVRGQRPDPQSLTPDPATERS